MEVPSVPVRTVRFGAFAVDLRAGELRKNGRTIRLPEQPLQVLSMLLERTGEVVTRDELRQRLWPAHTFVDFDHGLNNAIKKLRDVLGDSAESPRYIETLPKRGYRFICHVNGAEASAAAQTLPPMSWWLRRWVAGPLAAALLLAALLIANIGGLRERLFGTGSRLPPASLAVLPLENLTGDAEQEYFVDAIHDELITQLAQISSLKVISRYSVVRIKQEKGKSLQDIARELGVDTVMEGTVQRAGDRIHLSVQVIRAQDDRHLWARSYDRELRDVARLPADIARAMASDLAIQGAAREQERLAGGRSINPEAYEAFLRGLYRMNRMTLEDIHKGAEYFQEALRDEPDYAPAYAGLADSYACLGLFRGLEPREAFPKAKAAVTRALALDPRLRYAHLTSGFIQMYYDWDWAGAEKEYRRALELSPGYAEGHWTYAILLTALGRFDDAEREFELALRVDPVNPGINNEQAWLYFIQRRYDRATELYRKNTELDPAFMQSHRELGRVYAQRGMFKESLAELQEALALGREPSTVSELAYAYGRAGMKREARKLLAELGRADAQFLVYLGLGEKDAALRSLEKAFQERSPYMIFLKVDPRFDPLREDPRFQALLRRMNFPQ